MGNLYPHPVILASRSPRRQELLKQIGVAFELLDIEIDETVYANEAPLAYVERMAQEKAKTAWQSLLNKANSEKAKIDSQERGLLAADTCVVLQQQILGKPENKAQARQMLATLSGRIHQVMTCVALANSQGIQTRTSITDVTFATLDNSTIEDYINFGEGADKAGGYAIQGMAAKFIQSISGSYSGVVGLPLYETSVLLDNHFKVRQ